MRLQDRWSRCVGKELMTVQEEEVCRFSSAIRFSQQLESILQVLFVQLPLRSKMHRAVHCSCRCLLQAVFSQKGFTFRVTFPVL